MTSSTDGAARAQVVAAFVRDGDRVLLCHRSAGRRWYPDVWDLPGGHVERGETAGAALVRELREELGIAVPTPAGAPMWQVRGETFEMTVWLVETWTGTPANLAPEEHDAIAWFEAGDLAGLHLAHESYLDVFTGALSPTPPGPSPR